MSPEVSMTVSQSLRAFVVIAALVCLCVSSNVGPQFFPLPATTQTAEDLRPQPASEAHPVNAQNFRVPMMAQSKKRADNESQSDQLIALQSNPFGFARDTRFPIEIGYAVPFLASVTMTPRIGRAPPSLV
jgi:hypothetical protein